MKIEAKGSWLVLRHCEAPKKIGIIDLPESSREEMMMRNVGEIVAVGPDVLGQYEEGQVVAYPNSKMVAIPGLDGLVRRAVQAEHIIGIVTEDSPMDQKTLKMIEQRQKDIEKETAAEVSAQQMARAAGRIALAKP